MDKRWTNIVVLSLAVFSTGLVKAAESIPANWQIYENKNVGFSLIHPPSMTIQTGKDAVFRGFIVWEPRPDIRFALPEASLKDARISDAAVVVYAPDESCPPHYSPSGSGTQLIGGRPFYHWTGGDGAGGNKILGDFFCVMHRGKPFTIAAVIQSYYHADDTPDDAKRALTRQGEIKAILVQVLKTLVLKEPIVKPEAGRSLTPSK